MLGTLFTGLVAVAAAYFVYNKFFKKLQIAPKPEPYKKDYKKDVVYLYQFKRAQNLPNLSPFCLKVESFLRVAKIPYEVCDDKLIWSRNGAMPFVELNGEHIADSDLIEHILGKHFNIPSLPAKQEAQAQALSKLVDYHLFNILNRFKIMEDEFFLGFLEFLSIPKLLHPIVLPVLTKLFYTKIYTRSKMAIGDFDPEDLDQLLQRDLQVIKEYLGDQKFLFGDKLYPIDATVFGHLATVYYPFRNHFCNVIEKDFPSILEYLERVRHEIYPNDFTI
uniref:Uncharacterized protein n=1 Tax=Caenorhabditis japonica TaxID=281687 RepID=A0A8R1DHY8_CAEJA